MSADLTALARKVRDAIPLTRPPAFAYLHFDADTLTLQAPLEPNHHHTHTYPPPNHPHPNPNDPPKHIQKGYLTPLGHGGTPQTRPSRRKAGGVGPTKGVGPIGEKKPRGGGGGG